MTLLIPDKDDIERDAVADAWSKNGGELLRIAKFWNINSFIKSNESLIPNSLVLDVGLISSRGWAVIEANAAWGAGLNGCDATKAIRSIANASRRIKK